jgi:hypothetical protein
MFLFLFILEKQQIRRFFSKQVQVNRRTEIVVFSFYGGFCRKGEKNGNSYISKLQYLFTVCSCKDRYDHSIGTVDSFEEIA